jgi:signal transduction histidine kinase
MRVRLAVLGFLAIYVPVLLLFGVVLATDTDTEVLIDSGIETQDTSATSLSEVTWTIVALGPVAAGLSWWWAGRAVRPIERIRAVAEEITESDLSRRIGTSGGTTEIESLAASFDAMLGRLEQAAKTQRELIEETSHEIRNPLMALTTNAEVLLAHPNPTMAILQDGLERSRRTAERMQTAVDELLVDARSRARTLDRQPADVMSVVRGAVGDAVEATIKDVEVQISGPPEAVCAVDEATVRRAVFNLVDNAIRYSGEGSVVHVGVEIVDAVVAVVVTDHGCGVPADEQGRIFERRWRGSNGGDVDGMGLGLSIAHQVAQAHGGELTVVSPGPDGDGSVFRLTLRR